MCVIYVTFWAVLSVESGICACFEKSFLKTHHNHTLYIAYIRCPGNGRFRRFLASIYGPICWVYAAHWRVWRGAGAALRADRCRGIAAPPNVDPGPIWRAGGDRLGLWAGADGLWASGALRLRLQVRAAPVSGDRRARSRHQHVQSTKAPACDVCHRLR